MKHPIALLLTCLLLFPLSFLPAQIPVSAYAEAALESNGAYPIAQGCVGWEFGRHDVGLEFAPGGASIPFIKLGLRYRYSLLAAAAQGPLDPFVQVGFSSSNYPAVFPSRPTAVAAENVDATLGLKVGLGLGFSLRGYAGMRLLIPREIDKQVTWYGYQVLARPVAGIGLAYSVGLNHMRTKEIPDEPASMGQQHEFGLALSRHYLQNWIGYSDIRIHYAFRFAPRWDFRFVLDVPTWPFDPAVTSNRFDWRPGVFLGSRFYAFPGARFGLFAEGGLFLPSRFPLNAVSIGGLRFNFEPEFGTGLRARITPALHAELVTSMRLLFIRGIHPGIADNGVRLGLAYRFGRVRAI
jgi:hypothetical protein